MGKVAQKGRKSYKANPILTHRPSDETDLEIMSINSGGNSWKANTCMLSKSHEHYGAHCDGSSISLAQTESDATVFSFEQLHLDNKMDMMSFEAA